MHTEKNDLLPHWLVLGVMMTSLLIYVFIGHRFGHTLLQPLPEAERMVLRTVFYILAIAGFPVTNLIRHIQLRLNQTMPGIKSPRTRYLLTVSVSLILMESIGLLGLVMFLYGDDFNTLYIFTGLAALGLFLYRPKRWEYESIAEGLSGDIQ